MNIKTRYKINSVTRFHKDKHEKFNDRNMNISLVPRKILFEENSFLEKFQWLTI